MAFSFFSLNISSQVEYIAHRGASHDAPENTVASAKLAWDQGADAVELDIHLAKDNRVMVIHDKETKRTCTGKNYQVRDTPSLLMRDLDAGIWKGDEFKGEKIPFISEIIETIPEGKKLYVEIKCGDEVIPYLNKSIEKTGKGEQIVFICFDWNTILKTKQEFPDNACYWLSTSKSGLRKKMEQIIEAGLQGVDLKSPAIDGEVMTWAKELGLEVLAWTVDEPDEAKRLVDLGVVRITTNRPAWLKEQIK